MQGTKRPRSWALGTALFVVGVITVACAETDSDGRAYALVSPGVLTVCTHVPFEPFEFETEDGSLAGFDVDLLVEIADRLDLEVEFLLHPFDGIWLLPADGACDLAAAAITINEGRARPAPFTFPYFDADQSLLVRAQDRDELSSLSQLAGRVIAVQAGSTGEDYARRRHPPEAELLPYKQLPEMVEALVDGRVDAILQDLPANAVLARSPQLAIVDTFPTGEQYGFAASPRNLPLVTAINVELAELRSDGTLERLRDKWLGDGSAAAGVSAP